MNIKTNPQPSRNQFPPFFRRPNSVRNLSFEELRYNLFVACIDLIIFFYSKFYDSEFKNSFGEKFLRYFNLSDEIVMK